ncbi:MAG: hypothetical protein HRU34_13845 [Richelia sp.]|nr:hypothetical protein [Richelia sp.]CDN15182.1 O-methyltransferase family protein [C1] [Richelia intracellularis]
MAETKKKGVAESGDDFTKFSTISQWFQTLIYPALMQRQKKLPNTKYLPIKALQHFH